MNDAGNRFQLLFVDDAVNVINSILTTKMKESFTCVNVASHTIPSLMYLAENIILKLRSESKIKSDKTISYPEHIMDTS